MAGQFALVVALGYLLGSVPMGLLLTRLFKGIDIRQHGSGNIGAANVLRVVGFWAATLALIYDIGKGALPVLLARLLSGSPTLAAVAALAAVAGHTWPVWLRFRGGKGVATALGALLVLDPLLGGIAAAVGLPLMVITRYVSFGSLAGALAALAAALAFYAAGRLPAAHLAVVALVVAVIVYRHRDNLGRLLSGTESKLGQSAPAKRPGR